jgi:hypothetical protein
MLSHVGAVTGAPGFAYLRHALSARSSGVIPMLLTPAGLAPYPGSLWAHMNRRSPSRLLIML